MNTNVSSQDMPYLTKASELLALQQPAVARPGRCGQLTPPRTPTFDSTATDRPVLRLPPSPTSTSSLSSSSSSSASCQPRGLRPAVPAPHIIITNANGSSHVSPWKRCKITRPEYSSTHLAPPPTRSSARARLRCEQETAAQRAKHEAHLALLREQQEWFHERQRDVAAHQAKQQQEQELARSFREGESIADLELLRPITRELVRWRLVTFYESSDAQEVALKARAGILSRDIDWESTRQRLQKQQRQYGKRQRRAFGLLPKWLALRGLDLLSAVRRAANEADVPLDQLTLAMEAFAGHLSLVKRRSIRNLAEQKEWEVLAGILLADSEYLTADVNRMLFPHERMELFNNLCLARRGAEQEYFSVLEKRLHVCRKFLCCNSYCKRQRKVLFRLSETENAKLDGAFELTAHFAAESFRPQRRPESEVSGKSAREAKTRKSVCISVNAEQDESEVARSNWDSQEEKVKRRRERREMLFGKEDDDEDEENADEQDQKRRKSVEKVAAANAKWNRMSTLAAA